MNEVLAQISPRSLYFPVDSVNVQYCQLFAREKFCAEDEQQLIQKVEHQGLHIMSFSLKVPAETLHLVATEQITLCIFPTCAQCCQVAWDCKIAIVHML